MAEQEGGGGSGLSVSSFKAVLSRKVGGVPVWVIFAVGVLALVWWFRRKPAAKPDDTDTLMDTSSQTFPYANPMNYSSDVFVNINGPAQEDKGPDAPAQTSPVRTTVKVYPGDSVVNTIKSLQQQGVPITWDKFLKLNPQVVKNINWSKDPAHREWDAFRGPDTYKLV